MPEFIKVREHLGMDFGAADTIHISQNTQNPPPQNEGWISMPTSQGPTRNDADIISKAFTTVCMIRENIQHNGSENKVFTYIWLALPKTQPLKINFIQVIGLILTMKNKSWD